ncbi:MAG: hypothetical protein LBT13_04535 [Treponema sp.]|nr:hypothetical protein [Treponema sp.]
MVFPTVGSYHVSAYINNEYSLDEYSIIKGNDAIRPYFATSDSIADDPDVRGLTVFLQTPGGVLAGGKIRYILDTVKTVKPETNSTDVPEPEVAPPVEPQPEQTVEEVLDAETVNDQEPVYQEPIYEEPVYQEPVYQEPIYEEPVYQEPIYEEPVYQEPIYEEPVYQEPIYEEPVYQEPIYEEPVYQEPVYEAESEPVIDETPEEIIEENPGEIVSGETEEASGEPSITEPEQSTETTVKEPTVVTEEKPIPEKPVEKLNEDRVLYVAHLDKELPSFTLSSSLEIGQYSMVFQIQGDQGVLYKIEKPLYFLGNAQFVFDDIQRYLPGVSATSHLIPPGSNVLLEAEVLSDKRLDPYLIWYSGRKRIGEGKLSEGVNRFIWKVPEHTGFHAIKAELFPFQPGQGFKGTTKELSLPVSAKSAPIGYFSKKADEYIQWYQFQGTLQDAKNPGNTGSTLRSKNNKPPQWLPYAGIYGLSIGPDDVYVLPGVPFILDKTEQSSGQLNLHCKPLAEGTIVKMIFNAHFNPADLATAGVDMKVSITKGKLTITLTAEGEVYEDSISSEILKTQNFITLLVNFSIHENSFTANIYVEETGKETRAKTFILSKPLSGAGTVQFGEETTGNNKKAVAVFDELAIAFTREPFEAPLEEKIEPPLEALGDEEKIETTGNETAFLLEPITIENIAVL